MSLSDVLAGASYPLLAQRVDASLPADAQSLPDLLRQPSVAAADLFGNGGRRPPSLAEFWQPGVSEADLLPYLIAPAGGPSGDRPPSSLAGAFRPQPSFDGDQGSPERDFAQGQGSVTDADPWGSDDPSDYVRPAGYTAPPYDPVGLFTTPPSGQQDDAWAQASGFSSSRSTVPPIQQFETGPSATPFTSSEPTGHPRSWDEASSTFDPVDSSTGNSVGQWHEAAQSLGVLADDAYRALLQKPLRDLYDFVKYPENYSMGVR